MTAAATKQNTLVAFFTVLFASLPATIAASATLVLAWQQGAQIDKIETHTNSMVEKLEKVAHAEGMIQGAEGERANPSGTETGPKRRAE